MCKRFHEKYTKMFFISYMIKKLPQTGVLRFHNVIYLLCLATVYTSAILLIAVLLLQLRP